MSARDAVRRYISEGWSVLPIPRGSKAPDEKDWVNRTFSEEDFAPDSNVGVRLGTPSGNLVDVDLDVPEAVTAAKSLMPHTERIHGRPGTGASHYWFITEVKSEKWQDVDGKVLCEIRSTGGQTVLPPSIHPSGEELYWEIDRHPGSIDPGRLRRAVRSVATAALLARHWPSGSRHVAARDLAGFLASRELDGREVVEIIQVAATIAKDEEVADRVRVAHDTVRTFDAGGKTTGAPTLEASVGKEVVALLLRWYGGNNAVHDGIVNELNQKHFVARLGKDVVIGLEEGDEVTFQQERSLHLRYANQKVKIGEKQRGQGKGEAIYETKYALWRQHPKRREFRTVTFAPPPKIAPKDDYNLWKGFAVEPMMPPRGHESLASEATLRAWVEEHARPRCARYLELVHDVICGGEPHRQEEYYEYLIDLLALTVQQPGVPSEVAVVLKGERGTGKGMFVRNFGSLFGRHFAQIAKPEQIVGKFNASCSAKVVIFADEAFYAGDKRDLGALKVLITEPTLRIERKGIDPVEEPNFVHLFMASNEDWHTPAGFHERRFFALSVSPHRMQDHDYFEVVQDELRAGGREALLAYLLARDITPAKRQALRRAPRTDELRRQQDRTLSTELKWWKRCLERGRIGDLNDGEWPANVSIEEIHAYYLRYCDDLKINRRLDDSVLARDVLAPWLGASYRPMENGVRRSKRVLLPINEARAKFDEVAGTKTPWDQPSPDDEPSRPPTENLPFEM